MHSCEAGKAAHDCAEQWRRHRSVLRAVLDRAGRERGMVPRALAQGGVLKGSVALACRLEQKGPAKKD